VLAFFALWRNTTHDAAFPVLGLVLWPVAAVLAGVRSFDDLQPSSQRAAYAAIGAALGALAVFILAVLTRPAEREQTDRPAEAPLPP
jgi:hypothetical protein